VDGAIGREVERKQANADDKRIQCGSAVEDGER
jgi:hypothetical protein